MYLSCVFCILGCFTMILSAWWISNSKLKEKSQKSKEKMLISKSVRSHAFVLWVAPQSPSRDRKDKNGEPKQNYELPPKNYPSNTHCAHSVSSEPKTKYLYFLHDLCSFVFSTSYLWAGYCRETCRKPFLKFHRIY